MNSILIYLLICIGLGIYIFIKKDKFKLEAFRIKGIPIAYIVFTKSRIGEKFVEKIARRYTKQVKVLGWLCVGIGFVAMILVVGGLVFQIYTVLQQPELAEPTVKLILPIQSKFSVYVPLEFWLISLFIVAGIHEFGHALLARAYGIPLKGIGLAFAGIIIPFIPAAFVEPDKEAFENCPKSHKLAILAAGGGFNIILGLVVAAFYLPFMLSIEYGSVLFWFKQLFAWILILNIAVGMFNLLPIIPLDGGKIIHAFGNKRVTAIINATCLSLLLFSIIQGYL